MIDIRKIFAGLLIAAFAMLMLVYAYEPQIKAWMIQSTLDMQAYDAAAAGRAAGRATVAVIEAVFWPGIMIGALIIVARFMRRRKAKSS